MRFTVSRHRFLFCLWLAALCTAAAKAQSTQNQLRPELDVYVRASDAVRFVFTNSFRGDRDTGDWQGYFAAYIETALKPLLRRELAGHPDVYRNRYLSVRAGYQRRAGIGDSATTAGNTGILELTSRYMLPWHLVISDRNRGDFRFLQGQPFAPRYRNRLRLERDIRYHRLTYTPYVYDEIYYDTRYDRWTPNRFAAGVEVAIHRHLVLSPYYLRQHSTRSNPPHINAFGFKVQLYF